MDLEGALRIGLTVNDGRIERIRITSTRPDVARSLLQGRSRAEIQAAVPLLFSICGRSQAAASELACAAAAGQASTPDMLTRCSAAISAEMVREGAWRTLLDWPQWIGEKPAEDAVQAARAAQVFQFAAPADSGARAIAVAALGMAADEWLALRSLSELDRWIDAGETASARFMRQVRDDDAAGASSDPGALEVPLLDGRHHAWMVELWQACDADPGFARHPTWHGAPAETGALARLQSDPLIGALIHRSASRVPARFMARLRELALLLAGRASAAVGAQAVPSGGGIAWVENARGLLIHQVRLEQGRAELYRIVAPTEWNFHPDGALASALAHAPAADLAGVTKRATRLVHSLDPCVACRVEFDDA
ncbi:MAG TPA: nickel-dependent hydrogenase large subunit [Caldimonas sp.]